jgi:ElaB/YqjD/DUF883 family membrane-anchored ribosome-binding protein
MEAVMAYEVTTGLRRIAQALRDTVSEHGHATDLRGRGEDARAELAKLWSQIEDLVEHRLRPAAREARRDAWDRMDDGRDMALDAAGRLRDATRAHPLLTIGIAVAATWMATELLRRRR